MDSQSGRRKADGAVVETVRVEVAGLAPGVTLAGENEHEAKAGRPEQDNETALLKGPNCGERVMV